MMEGVKPFKINVAQERLDRLRQRLDLAHFPREVKGAPAWSRGPPLAELQCLVDYWKGFFSWREVEDRLNRDLPQFTRQINVPKYSETAYNMHFVHQRSKVENAIPLLFLHGWPGNFTEVQQILPSLVEPSSPDQPAFHVVAPSYLDFGFSDASNCAGFNVVAHGHVCHVLMKRLGYEKYVIQGGDMGTSVARAIVQYYPASVGGHLLNDAWACKPDKDKHPELWKKQASTEWTQEEKDGIARNTRLMQNGIGFHAIQSTKPLTLGYSMADSPVGLMAWIYEKMHDWSDNHPWSDDEILTWASIYYFSVAGPNASQQIYLEGFQKPDEIDCTEYNPVPLGISRYPAELGPLPRLWFETQGPVVFFHSHSKGGHFAATEQPEELAADLRVMFGKGGPCEKCCGEVQAGYEA